MAKKLEPRTLKGFKDTLPAEAIAKTKMLQILQNVFASYGFAPIETPHLELTELLVKDTADDEVGKQLYRFQDNGKRDVCLRFDLTVPFARFVVQHKNELGIPFKRYAIGNVFRGEQPQLGRYREFTQCDFDIVGVKTGSADAEIVQVIASSLQALGIERFKIRVNNRKIMNGLALALGVDANKTPEMLRILDKIDKIGKEKVAEQLINTLGFSEAVTEELLAFVGLKADSPQALLISIAAYKERGALLAEGIEELEYVSRLLATSPLTAAVYEIDFSIARGLGYYTGTIYETTLLDMPEIGSVCSGGRYDNLTQNFSRDELPGVGASVGLDRLIAALLELGLLDTSSSPTQVLCVAMDEVHLPAVHAAAHTLRTHGLAVEVYPAVTKVKKQFQYADRKGIRYVLVQGETEIENDSYTIKDLQTGEQQTLSTLPEILALLGH